MKRIAALMTMAAGAALAQSSPEGLTARQLFYDEGKPAAQAKPAAQGKPVVVAKAEAPKPDVPKKAGVPAAKKTPEAKTPEVRQPEVIVAKTGPVEVHRPNVPVMTVANVPVAIRYSLVKLDNGAEVEVPPSHVFRSGDQVRLKVEANQRGYLYLIARGSSGNWKPLFPSREASDNVVEARRGYDVPSSTQAFTFDDQEGKEKLFLLFSRQPISDLDSQIEGLRKRPASNDAEPAKAPMVLAQNLNDRRVENMRAMYSRDLIIETVDAKKTVPVQPASAPAASGNARRPENAVYVASTSRAGDSRVVADIELTHGAK